MGSKEVTHHKRRGPRAQSIILLLIIAISVVVAGWVLVVVSTNFAIPPRDFVALPNTPLSTQGSKVFFAPATPIFQSGLAVGVKGRLLTSTGSPVAGAQVYMTYYLEGAYRTQVATTNQDGSFEAQFPMNWTGWLPLTLTYFGDGQHQGIRQVVNVSGEAPY